MVCARCWLTPCSAWVEVEAIPLSICRRTSAAAKRTRCSRFITSFPVPKCPIWLVSSLSYRGPDSHNHPRLSEQCWSATNSLLQNQCADDGRGCREDHGGGGQAF